MPEKKYIVALTEEERSELKNLVSKGKGAACRIKHAHITVGPSTVKKYMVKAAKPPSQTGNFS